jgi:hypothetical protein
MVTFLLTKKGLTLCIILRNPNTVKKKKKQKHLLFIKGHHLIAYMEMKVLREGSGNYEQADLYR